MEMATITLLVSGSGLFCALITWLLCAFKNKSKDTTLIEQKSKIDSLEKSIVDLKEQLTQKESETGELRSSLELSKREKAIAETKLEEAAKHVEEQKQLLDKAEEKFATVLKALAGDALKSNNKSFIELANENIGKILNEAKGEFSKKEESIKNIVKPLEEALKRYETQINELERNRSNAFGILENQIKNMVQTEQILQKETSNLVMALKRPEVKGRWGEITLKRVVELAGMIEHCDYIEQMNVTTEEGRQRPDMIIHLPADREIVVDSKVSLNAYMEALSCTVEEKRIDCIKKHASQIKKYMKDLGSKTYWEQFPKAPEFVVMFIPGESFLSSALEQEPELIEEGIANKVIISTPTTLIALLRAIAFGWRQELITKNALEIANLGKELYDRFDPFIEHINVMGGALSKSVVSFNRMVMSLERRVLVSVKKFKELGASSSAELSEIQHIEQIPMKANEDELTAQSEAVE